MTDEETVGEPKFPPKEGEEGYVPPTALRDEETGELSSTTTATSSFRRTSSSSRTRRGSTWSPPRTPPTPTTGRRQATSRGDLTMVVNHLPPSLRRPVVHSDGTRVVRDPDGDARGGSNARASPRCTPPPT